ncbi:Crp/Fnr family transcriptional regulator [Bradyrhizobium sp. KBS0727]|uniref:Crp/Fnr family transcriptional regulator n=1 Tax=unclassified Bradyrhizobium TaxID=2631580 RepID=UPI00110DCFBA|nr:MULTISPECIES: Crp/Fnr family transcriptional regulator [unclassified Bradyrhizobium]QDW39828.1 Crp/Fnr family transcriptional regulator [Bradyrhizobium sp. KBS0725]QDW46431.1 Crp/Fnr family transcriptional regulator [Bradyrhizobium sp. KBS0727]
MLVQANKRSFVKNAILASLPVDDLLAVGKCVEPIFLKGRMILQEPKRRSEYVYFIESGVVSQRIVSADSVLETAVVGYTGAVGAADFLGGYLPTHQSVVLFPGSSLRIRVDDLSRLMNERPEVQKRVRQYSRTLAVHSAQTGLCGVRHDLKQRLACWICLVCDALDGCTLPITHEYLSTMLAIRRSGVTETLLRFEGQGLIRKARGVVQVDERKRLEQNACNCYGIISNAYAPVPGLVA